MKNHAMAKSGRETNKKRRWCNLALLESFLAMQGRSCMVVGGGGVARGREKDG
jgi:hypothetical protein